MGGKPAMLVVHPTHLEYLLAQENNDGALLDGLSVTCSFERELPVLLDESGRTFEL